MQVRSPEVVRAAWSKPTLVQKRLEETRASLGRIHDGLTDQES